MKKRIRHLCITLGSSVIAVAAFAQPVDFDPVRLSPEDLVWTALPNGTWQAEIAGHDTASGLYAYQLRIPRGFRLAPHFHPDDRVVAVISGTFYLGFGERFDETALKALPAGSSWTEPKGQAHFAWAKEGDVVLHVVGVGPSGSTTVGQPQQ